MNQELTANQMALEAWSDLILDITLKDLRRSGDIDLTGDLIYLRLLDCTREEVIYGPPVRALDEGREMWVERIEYIDEDSFRLHAIAAEPDVFFNPACGGRLPERVPGTEETLIVRKGDMQQKPCIAPLYMLTISYAVHHAVERMEGLTDSPHAKPMLQKQLQTIDRRINAGSGFAPEQAEDARKQGTAGKEN